jgi:DNA-directed RNA polymerase subunit RPC12/RpoP
MNTIAESAAGTKSRRSTLVCTLFGPDNRSKSAGIITSGYGSILKSFGDGHFFTRHHESADLDQLSGRPQVTGQIMPDESSNTAVLCARCKRPIPLKHAEKVTEEFSARCPNCGFRGFYRIKDIRTIDPKASR